MPSQEILDEIFSNLESLPEVPIVALQVHRLLDDPETNAHDLSRVIMMDPGLTSKVLKLCNSAEYGFSRKIGTITEAVSILGYKELKRIIFTIISHGFLNRPVEGYALEKGALWDNALACAAYSRHIANKISFKETELAFVAALLRDIGKIAMEGYIQGFGLALESAAREHKYSFVEAEEQVVGVSHTVVGAGLAQRWNLPDALLKTIEFHHKPSDAPADTKPEDMKLICIVHLADIFTMMSGQGVGVDGLMYPLDPIVFKHLGLKPDGPALETLYAELLALGDEITAMAASFDTGKGPGR
jgi:putative nucleotidyltransferase with HDIG domain